MPPFSASRFVRSNAVEPLSGKESLEIAAFLRHQKKVDEIADITSFLAAYPKATGEKLLMEEIRESPDAICSKPDGTLIGLEFTTIRRSPGDARWQAILDYKYEMGPSETLNEIERLIFRKAELRPNYSEKRNILVLAICESDFDLAVRLAERVPIDDLAQTGFEEIWLADFQGVREQAHREVRLFGLFPEHARFMTGRSMFDQKPYG